MLACENVAEKRKRRGRDRFNLSSSHFLALGSSVEEREDPHVTTCFFDKLVSEPLQFHSKATYFNVILACD